MKLEFLAKGSPECPLIRLYDFTQEEAQQLRQVLHSLAEGSLRTAALEEMPFVEAIRGCQLKLLAGPRDLGIHSTSSNAHECELTRLGWDNIGSLTDPFCRPDSKGYQWLMDHGLMRLLISHDGTW